MAAKDFVGYLRPTLLGIARFLGPIYYQKLRLLLRQRTLPVNYDRAYSVLHASTVAVFRASVER